MSIFQILPDLMPDEYEALKADIHQRGIVVPVLVDEAGNIIDGHHRHRIAEELQIDCPRKTQSGLSDAEKVGLAVALNVARRHLTQERRRELVERYLKAAPEKSDRQIAKRLGVTHPTVAAVRRNMEERGDVENLSTRTDSKGRKQPVSKPKPATKPTKEQASLDAQQVKERFGAACVDVRNAADKLNDHDAFEVVQRARDTLIRLLPRLKPQDAAATIAKIRQAVNEGS